MPKVDHYIAIPQDEYRDVRPAMWDMLRYDSCYPVGNAPEGWVVLKQPFRKGVKGGFTLDRWASFGFRDVLVGQSDSGIPYYMLRKIEERNSAKQG